MSEGRFQITRPSLIRSPVVKGGAVIALMAVSAFAQGCRRDQPTDLVGAAQVVAGPDTSAQIEFVWNEPDFPPRTFVWRQRNAVRRWDFLAAGRLSVAGAYELQELFREGNPQSYLDCAWLAGPSPSRVRVDCGRPLDVGLLPQYLSGVLAFAEISVGTRQQVLGRDAICYAAGRNLNTPQARICVTSDSRLPLTFATDDGVSIEARSIQDAIQDFEPSVREGDANIEDLRLPP